MPTRNLGRTGYHVGLFSLGGQAAIEQPDNEAAAVAIVERALDLGVNYIDTAAMYGGGRRWSQRYIGQVMKRRRGQVYLASKTHDRSRDGSLRLLEESLTLLNTDHLDAWSITSIRRMTLTASSLKAERSKPCNKRASRRWFATWASPAIPTPTC